MPAPPSPTPPSANLLTYGVACSTTLLDIYSLQNWLQYLQNWLQSLLASHHMHCLQQYVNKVDKGPDMYNTF